MNLRFFIDRPVFSGVISVVIVLLGVIAMFSLPVEQYPDIAPPTINVWATYPGANAETVQKAVIVPLEEAINGVEDMTYMTSTASNTGDASINIYFKQGANADMAAVNVQNRVNAALSQLPATTKYGGIYDVISGKFRLGRGNRSLSDRGRSAGGWQGTVHLGYLQPYAGQNKER